MRECAAIAQTEGLSPFTGGLPELPEGLPKLAEIAWICPENADFRPIWGLFGPFWADFGLFCPTELEIAKSFQVGSFEHYRVGLYTIWLKCSLLMLFVAIVGYCMLFT